MDNFTEKQTESQLPEAPASATVKIKSPNGYEWLFTIRDEKASVLSFKMKAMEENWIKAGFTPLPQGNAYKKEAKPVNYIEGRLCPKCGNRLVNAEKRDGTKFIKCETNKWDPFKKMSTGCDYVDWGNARQDLPVLPGGRQVGRQASPEREYIDY